MTANSMKSNVIYQQDPWFVSNHGWSYHHHHVETVQYAIVAHNNSAVLCQNILPPCSIE